MNTMTHFNRRGEAHMVDVGSKDETHRVALATGSIRMQAETLARIRQGDHGKGDVLAVARLAGIMAAKRTAELIPLCHPLPLTAVEVEFELDDDHPGVHCRVRAETRGRTGVEMEALTGVQLALLTIYDMCKGVDRGMNIGNVRLIEKEGGRSGHWQAE